MFGWGKRREGGEGRNRLPDDREVHLALYKYDACPFCSQVYRAIDELDVDVEYRDIRSDPQWRADLSRRTGRTQVPMLLIDEEPMMESADIAAWLRANFPRKG